MKGDNGVNIVNIGVWGVWGNHSVSHLLLAQKCEFLAFPSDGLVLEFLNINTVQLLSVILNNGAQNNTSKSV